MKEDVCKKKYILSFHKKSYGASKKKKIGLGKISNIFFMKWIKHSEKD